MSGDLVSRGTRTQFRDYFVHFSTLGRIETAFDTANIPRPEGFVPPETSQRRALVDAYYSTLDFSSWGDVNKILRVYGEVLVALEDSVANLFSHGLAKQKFDALVKSLERDGFAYANGRVVPLRNNLQVLEVQEAARSLDAPELQRQLDRLKASVDEDPALAIGTAKELVETVCKTILTENGQTPAEDTDITALVKATRSVLALLPEDVPNAAKGADIIRKLLGNLGVIAQSLGELRNLYGTGHGKHGKARGLSPRHAQLAVGASATLIIFLLQTHEERKKKASERPETS